MPESSSDTCTDANGPIHSMKPADPVRSPAAIARFLVTALALVGLDLWTKYLAFARLQPGQPFSIIPGWLQLEVTTNRGAAFGLGQGQRALFLAVSIFAVGFLCYLFATSGRRWFYQLILGLLLAGVLGNLYDRVLTGQVRDMIHALPRWPHFFPWIFNLADSYLCVGVALMVLYGLIMPDGAKRKSP